MSSFLLLPLGIQLSVLFVFGLIIGSFLNVVLYRLHTGKSLSGHSHCLSCARRLKGYELIPLVSYLILRGRCRTCHSYIPARYFLVELLTGILFVLTYLTFSGGWIAVSLGLLFVSLLIVVAVYDLRHLIIPDELVVGLLVVALASSGLALFVSRDPTLFMFDMGAAALGSLFFFLLWQLSNGKWIGFGDVKLAFPLGLMVGCSGVFSMIVLSFWVGATIGLLLLGLQFVGKRGQRPLRLWRRTLTMKSALPFAPFLIVGFMLVWLWEVNVIAILTYGA